MDQEFHKYYILIHQRVKDKEDLCWQQDNGIISDLLIPYEVPPAGQESNTSRKLYGNKTLLTLVHISARDGDLLDLEPMINARKSVINIELSNEPFSEQHLQSLISRPI